MVMRTDASTGQLVDDGTAAEPQKPSDKPTVKLKVWSPYRVYFDEAAYSVSAVNTTGPFDILPKHHNFITLLEPCEVAINGVTGVRRIRISGGLMHVRGDEITVFLNV